VSMSPERQARNHEAAFGPAPYGPVAGFASIATMTETPPCAYPRREPYSRCRCGQVRPRGLSASSPCPACGELPHDDEGLEETRSALTERMNAGGLAVPKGSEP